jgi:uncharacterized protein
MTHAEWESLCDGCGQCCLIKVEEEVTDDIYLTRLACQLLGSHTCRCRDYADRRARVPDCVTISSANVGDIEWLPKSCAYRRIAEGRRLEWWHPLVSGDPETVHQAGVSVRGWSRSETGVHPERDRALHHRGARVIGLSAAGDDAAAAALFRLKFQAN